MARRAVGSGAPRRGAAVIDRLQVSCQSLPILQILNSNQCSGHRRRAQRLGCFCFTGPRWLIFGHLAQLAPNLAPTCPNFLPKMPPRHPKMSQDGPRCLQDAPRCPQDTSRWPKMPPRYPKMPTLVINKHYQIVDVHGI